MPPAKSPKPELPIIAFPDQKSWHDWLHKNLESPGIWMHFYKKATKIQSINYAEALDEALCFGWIDGQAKPFDDKSWLQRFTPRRPKSIWSKRNIRYIDRLTKEGRMQPSGLKQVEAAKADGRWAQAYDGPSTMEVPEDFLKELSKHKEAEAFFNTFNKTNKYAIAWRLQTAKKPETRLRRMNMIIEMLKKGEKFH